MKKRILILSITLGLIGFSSFTSRVMEDLPVITITGYYGDDAFAIVHRAAGDVTATLCPRTGVNCEIKYKDKEGDTVTYSSKKGKGRADMEFSS